MAGSMRTGSSKSLSSLATWRSSNLSWIFVPKEGLEPSHPFGWRILNPLRLPFRHFGLGALSTEARLRAQVPRRRVIDEHCNWRLSRAPIMPLSLRNRLNELAASFSAGVLDAIRGASLEELLSESPGGKARAVARTPVRSVAAAPAAEAPSRRRPGRLPRRSAGDISQAVDKIVALLGDNPAGLRAEQIRQKLGLQAKELPRPLKEGLDGGRLSKVGRKRATTYFAGASPKGKKAEASSPRAAKKAAHAKKGRARPKAAAKKTAAKKSRRAKATRG
jgi:hypothetical protein